jgi:hypothetical protein
MNLMFIFLYFNTNKPFYQRQLLLFLDFIDLLRFFAKIMASVIESSMPHVHSNELPSTIDCNRLSGAPVLSDSLHGDTYRMRSTVQAMLLKYLSTVLVKRFEQVEVADALRLAEQVKESDVAVNDSPGELSFDDIGRLRGLFPSIVIGKIGACYSEWFKSFANGIDLNGFFLTYGSPAGVKRLFEELFPNMSLSQFIDCCIDEVDVTVIREEVRSSATALLDKCKFS